MSPKIIEQAKQIIQEYADNPQDMDLTKTAVTVLDLGKESNLCCDPSWHSRQNVLGIKEA